MILFSAALKMEFRLPAWGVLFFLLFSNYLIAQQNTTSPDDSATFSIPLKMVKKVGPIPVYEDFASLEPIFRKQTDTTYVINFWATWCKPCVEELPYFEQLYQDLAGEKIRVILVSLDFPKKLESKLLPFVMERQLRSEVAALTDIRYNEWIDKVDPSWGGAIPVTLVYRSDHRKFVDDQFASYEELKELVISFL